jgi:hypothetical protein
MNNAGYFPECFKNGPWNGLGVVKIEAHTASIKAKKRTKKDKKVSSTNVR